jgi:hypothetical protein
MYVSPIIRIPNVGTDDVRIVGVSSIVPIPVTFSGQVYLDFTADCRIEAVRAYAEIPTYIDGKPVTIYELLPIPQLPV